MTHPCIDCHKRFAKSTIKKYDGKRCGACFNTEQDRTRAIPMDIDEDSVTKPTLGDHRQVWINMYPTTFEILCPKCRMIVIDVFTYQTDYVNSILTPMCRNCCHITMRRRHEPLNREVWLKYEGKKLVTKCRIRGINEINVFNFEKGHVIARDKGGYLIADNLRPVCGPCNKDMGTINMKEYCRKRGLNVKI